VLPPYLDYVQARRQQDLRQLDNHELLQELEGRYVRVMNEFAKEAIKLSYFGSAAHGELTARLNQIFGDAGPVMARQLSAGLDDDKTVETNIKLMEVARGQLSRDQFLDEFGHRGGREFELSQPRWREDPAFIDQMIENFRADAAADPARLHEHMKARREEAEQSLPAKLKARGAARAARGLEEICARVRRYMPYRETAKHYLLMGYELLRGALLEIDRRQKLDGGVFLLRLGELPALLAGRDFSQEMAERRRRRRVEPRINVPDVVTTDDLEAIGRPLPATGDGDTLRGTGLAPGSGTGPAAVLFDPAEASNLTPGYILVCPSTDPGWAPLFVSAAGLIMERGGVLSHGAVVARDLGIPAVVVKGATQSISTGERIRVDGDTGIASRVQPSHRSPAT
jgi:pyruvate,water dikinase